MTKSTRPHPRSRYGHRHLLQAAASLGVALALVAGCSTDPTGSGPTTTTGPGGTTTNNTGGGVGRSFTPFQAFDSCEELLDWTKAEMLERVTPWGLDGGYWWGRDGMAMEGDIAFEESDAPAETAAPAAPTAGDDSGSGSGGTSTTNTQEEGVDEGDLTETDGRYVYTAHDQKLRSVDLDNEELLVELDLPQGEHQMILSGDRLMLVTQTWTWPGSTIVSVYDVDEGVPTLLGRTHLEGQLLATRGIGGTGRVVIRHDITSRIPFVYPNRGTEAAEEEALEENQRVIEELTADQLLPRSFGETPNGSRGPLRASLDCDDVGVPGDFSGFGLTWVATVDLAGDGANDGASNDDATNVQGSSGLIADAQTVYASADHLYVGTIRYPDWTGNVMPQRPEPPHTNVHMFDLRSDGGSSYLATGTVQGTVLNQYSLSEHEGYLRVATTTDAGGFGAERDSGVHVFERRSDELVEVGAVRGLGLGESIQGVRFQGDVGYVVTFQQIDPLYVLDLSDPTRPTMEGELKIPGFSTYLHPIGDGLVIGVGFAGTDDGRITGSQLSLFDVSDPSDPLLIDTLDLGWSSEATFDPHAFLWWGPTSTVIVPGSRECIDPYTTDLGCGNAVVARVVDGEFDRAGELTHWFPIRRTMVAEGRLVSVSAESLRIWTMDALDLQATVDFTIL